MNKKALIFATFLILIALGGWSLLHKQRSIQNVPKQLPIASEQPVQTVEKPQGVPTTVPGSTLQQPATQSEIESVKDLIDGEYTFTPIDTTGWQTYQDEKLGLEVKIPKSFKKTEQGFTPPNPPVESSESTQGVENDVWFSIGLKNTVYYEGLQGKKIGNVPEKDLFDPLWSSFVDSGNVDVSVQKKYVNSSFVVIIKSIFKKEPAKNEFGGWIEGAYDDEAFFQCGKDNNICSVHMLSHKFSTEKQVLFYTVLSTLHSRHQ